MKTKWRHKTDCRGSRSYESRLDTIGAKSRKPRETSNEMWADNNVKHQI